MEWSKHKSKLADPIKTLAEAINTQSLAAFNAIALEDAFISTTSATVAEADWHGVYVQLATGNIYYPDPANFENGWHHTVYNGSTGVVSLQATATSYWLVDAALASEFLLQAGRSVKPMNTATVWLPVGHTATVPDSQSFYQFGHSSLSVLVSTTATISWDNTPPTATEGTEIMTLAWSAANNIKVDVDIPFTASGGAVAIASLFDSAVSTATSVMARSFAIGAGNVDQISFSYVSTMSSTATRTFSIRFGSQNGAHMIVNGIATATAGYLQFNGRSFARLFAQEYTT